MSFGQTKEKHVGSKLGQYCQYCVLQLPLCKKTESCSPTLEWNLSMPDTLSTLSKRLGERYEHIGMARRDTIGKMLGTSGDKVWIVSQSTEGAWEAKLEKTWENEKVGKKIRKIWCIWEIYGSVVVNRLYGKSTGCIPHLGCLLFTLIDTLLPQREARIYQGLTQDWVGNNLGIC
jgi:hypothetical protein